MEISLSFGTNDPKIILKQTARHTQGVNIADN